MTEDKLKNTLVQLKNEDIDWDEVNVDTIVDEMLQQTQTFDIELKEGLIEPLIIQIIEKNYISEESMEALTKRCLGENYLYLEIGDTASRNKMTRAFSMFVLKQLLARDRRDAFMSNNLFDQVRSDVILYLNLEQDYRSYTAEMGNSNSVLYSIDAISEIIGNMRLDQQYYTELFQTLLNKIFTYQTLYQHDEEQHTIDAIRVLLGKGLNETKLIDFLTRVPAFLEKQKEKLDAQQYWNLYKNCKSLLQAMYIRIDMDNERPLLFTEVKKCLTIL